jgi:hypothetical protein
MHLKGCWRNDEAGCGNASRDEARQSCHGAFGFGRPWFCGVGRGLAVEVWHGGAGRDAVAQVLPWQSRHREAWRVTARLSKAGQAIGSQPYGG